MVPYGDPGHEQVLVEHDAELMTAIAAWQQRETEHGHHRSRDLAAGHQSHLEQALAKIAEEHRVRQIAEIDAAMSSEPFIMILPDRAN